MRQPAGAGQCERATAAVGIHDELHFSLSKLHTKRKVEYHLDKSAACIASLAVAQPDKTAGHML